MLTKVYSKKTHQAQVTFELPAEVKARTACLCGEFNGWDTTAHPMKRRKDGRFTLTIPLEAGPHRFRYLVDGERWENDWAADDYVPNEYGSDDSVVQV